MGTLDGAHTRSPVLQLMTMAEVAEYLRVTDRTVRTYVANKTLPAPSRLGRRLLWKRADIDQVLELSRRPVLTHPTQKRRGRPRKY